MLTSRLSDDTDAAAAAFLFLVVQELVFGVPVGMADDAYAAATALLFFVAGELALELNLGVGEKSESKGGEGIHLRVNKGFEKRRRISRMISRGGLMSDKLEEFCLYTFEVIKFDSKCPIDVKWAVRHA